MNKGNRLPLWIKDTTKKLKNRFLGLRVYALVGKSGTGKSFRAKLVAERYGIDCFIDDGLLIQGDSIVAGKSAKRESIYIQAVRSAIFEDPLHRHEVIKAIRIRNISKILLIGTSERMVIKMASRLQLPLPCKIIYIEEISSEEDIVKAQRSRHIEGKHVIPVPAIEVERDYPQLLSKSIKVFFPFRKGVLKKEKSKVYEKSVVRPPWQNADKGKVAISESALAQMVSHCVDEFDENFLIKKIRFRALKGAYSLKVELEAPFGQQYANKLPAMRDYVLDRIERYTGIIIVEFDMVIAGVSKPVPGKTT